MPLFKLVINLFFFKKIYEIKLDMNNHNDYQYYLYFYQINL